MAHFILLFAPQLAQTFKISALMLPLHTLWNLWVQFVFKFWKVLCKALRLLWTFPLDTIIQSNGQMERINQVLKQYLLMYMNAHQHSCCELLHWGKYTSNNHVIELSEQLDFGTVYRWSLNIPLPIYLCAVSSACCCGCLSKNSEHLDRSSQELETAAKAKKSADKHQCLGPKCSRG